MSFILPGMLGVARKAQYSSNYSLDFDGVDDYVSLGTSMKSILDGATNFSFETWIKADSGTSSGGMIFQQENTDVGDSAHTRVSFVESSADPFYKLENIFRTASGTSNLRTGTLSLNTWHHFVGTFDGSASGGTHKIYLNGALVTTATGIGTAFSTSSANANARFGTTYKTTRPFDGHIAEFRMWDSTLDADAITSLYNNPGIPRDPRENFGNYDSWTGNLVGFWPMETDSGDTVVDLGSGGNDGTKGATGFPAWSTDSI
jgi:hypothetical protein